MRGKCHCGATSWSLNEQPESVTSCNCTICRRYAALWAYGEEGAGLSVSGETRVYVRGEKTLEFHFCSSCGCVIAWKSLKPQSNGRVRAAVNIRLTERENVANLPVRRFDGLDTFKTLAPDGRRVTDYWF